MDVDLYVGSIAKLLQSEGQEAAATQNGDAVAARAKIIGDYEAEMIDRGAKAVQSSLDEGSMSLDVETVKKMVMATKGHGQGT